RGARVDQLRNVLRPTGSQHVLGSDRVDSVVALPASPDSRYGGNVIDRVDSGAAAVDGLCIPHVADDALDVQFGQPRVYSPAQDADFSSARHELLDDVEAEKPAAAGDERATHCPSAHSASCSRLIFVLWRTSTGSEPG